MKDETGTYFEDSPDRQLARIEELLTQIRDAVRELVRNQNKRIL